MFVVRIFSRLPLPILYLFSDFIFLITYHLLKYRRKITMRNLKNAFPEKAPDELRAIERGFYRNLCDYAVETLRLLTMSKQELNKRMVYKNPELIEPFKAAHQSVIYLTSHQFNWEWLVAAGNFALPLPVDFVYQPLHNKFFNRFTLFIRTRFGAYAIRRADVAREIIKRKHLVRGVAIVADQFPGHGNDKRYWTNFLNQETAFFQGINQLAYMTQFPVFFAKVSRAKRGFYEIELEPIAQPPYEKDNYTMIENYARATERVIQGNPSGWLWSHNRWKKTRKDVD